MAGVGFAWHVLANALGLLSKGDGYHAIGQATSDAAIGRYGFLLTTVFVALGTGELLPGPLGRKFRPTTSRAGST